MLKLFKFSKIVLKRKQAKRRRQNRFAAFTQEMALACRWCSVSIRVKIENEKREIQFLHLQTH